jgi:hypothetical protein
MHHGVEAALYVLYLIGITELILKLPEYRHCICSCSASVLAISTPVPSFVTSVHSSKQYDYLSPCCRLASLSRSCGSSHDLRYDSSTSQQTRMHNAEYLASSIPYALLEKLVAVLRILQSAACTTKFSKREPCSEHASTCSESSCVHAFDADNCCALQLHAFCTNRTSVWS